MRFIQVMQEIFRQGLEKSFFQPVFSAEAMNLRACRLPVSTTFSSRIIAICQNMNKLMETPPHHCITHEWKHLP